LTDFSSAFTDISDQFVDTWSEPITFQDVLASASTVILLLGIIGVYFVFAWVGYAKDARERQAKAVEFREKATTAVLKLLAEMTRPEHAAAVKQTLKDHGLLHDGVIERIHAEAVQRAKKTKTASIYKNKKVAAIVDKAHNEEEAKSGTSESGEFWLNNKSSEVSVETVAKSKMPIGLRRKRRVGIAIDKKNDGRTKRETIKAKNLFTNDGDAVNTAHTYRMVAITVQESQLQHMQNLRTNWWDFMKHSHPVVSVFYGGVTSYAEASESDGGLLCLFTRPQRATLLLINLMGLVFVNAMFTVGGEGEKDRRYGDIASAVKESRTWHGLPYDALLEMLVFGTLSAMLAAIPSGIVELIFRTGGHMAHSRNVSCPNGLCLVINCAANGRKRFVSSTLLHTHSYAHTL
jgi:hypothetical protein